jgi:hypothetical protein
MSAAAIPSDHARKDRAGFNFTSFVWIAACATAFGAVLIPYSVFNDGDTYWHIAAGRWMLAHGQVLDHDVFSFTHAGQPWMSHEWLCEILMALAFGAGGWNGILVLFGISAAATAGLMTAEAGRKLGGIALPILIGLAFSIMSPSVLARPHLMALTPLVGWTVLLIRAREARRAPPLASVLVMTVWANLHGSFVFGFLLAGAFGLEALFDKGSDRLRTLRQWAVFGLASLIAACVSPHGVQGLIYPLRIMSMQTLNNIGEWKPLSFAVFEPLELALMAALYMGLVKGVRAPPLRLLIVLLLLHLTLIHQRYQIVLGAIAPLILAEPLATALGQGPQPPIRWRPSLGLLAAAIVAMSGWRMADPAVRHDDVVTPKSAMAHVPRALAALPVLNTYDFGGYLIFHGIRPFIDGRADMYGDDFMRLHNQLMLGRQPYLDQTIARYGIQWMLLSPREALARAMPSKPGWRKLYGDSFAVVFVRDAP